MMTELIRRVKFRCIKMEFAKSDLPRPSVGGKATLSVVQHRAEQRNYRQDCESCGRYGTVIVELVASLTRPAVASTNIDALVVQMRRKEEFTDQLTQGGKRGRGVDAGAQVRPVLQPLRVPRAERADFVDDPPIVGQLPRLVHSLSRQQIDVVEQKLPTILERDDAGWPPRGQVHGLSQNPWIAQHAA